MFALTTKTPFVIQQVLAGETRLETKHDTCWAGIGMGYNLAVQPGGALV